MHNIVARPSRHTASPENSTNSGQFTGAFPELSRRGPASFEKGMNLINLLPNSSSLLYIRYTENGKGPSPQRSAVAVVGLAIVMRLVIGIR